jgi:hypothetical protein
MTVDGLFGCGGFAFNSVYIGDGTLRLIAATLVAVLALGPHLASAQSADTHYTTRGTQIGTLLGDPATKAILNKHLPGMADNPQFEQASGMTLKDIQQFAADQISDKKLADIDADLAKVSKK